MLFWQILIDGFAISSLYALGAAGFTLIFGVTGVLNLSHGAIMVAAAVAAWAASGNLGADNYLGAAFGVLVALALSLATYYLIVRRLQLSRAVREEEKEIFILTATLLWGVMIQEAIAYFYTNNAKTVLPIVEGVVSILGVRTPSNEIFTALVCWATIGALWLFVNRSRAGKAVLAASMNPRGVTLLGIELSAVYVGVWAIYGALAGIAGVLLGMFLGVSSYSAGPLDRERVLDRRVGRPRQRLGLADRGLCRRLSRDAHRLSRFAGLSHDPGALAARRGDVRAPPRIDGKALDHAAPRALFPAGSYQPDRRPPRLHPAALCLRLRSGPSDRRLLFRRVLDGLGPLVRLRQ